MNTHIPIGLESLRTAVEEVCAAKHIYSTCRLLPPHMLLNLSQGEGQRTVIRYIARQYRANQIMHFGGLDDYLMFTCDGSLAQLDRMKCQIKSSAVYTNHFEGVVGIDVSALAQHVNEQQVTQLSDLLQSAGKTAVLVIFSSSVPSSKEQQLMQKIKAVLHRVNEINVGPYTRLELLAILENRIHECNATFSNELCREVILQYMDEFHMKTVQEVLTMADRLLLHSQITFGDFALTSENIQMALAPNNSLLERGTSHEK